jgi:RNA polymerase sigma-70 factor (ECF subfamily)
MRDFAKDNPVQAGADPAGSMGDYALLEAVAMRDADALGAFYDKYSGLVFALCLRTLRNRSEAEEVLIDVFHELWDRCDRYDPARSSPQTYLVLLARSRAIDRLRSRSGPAAPAWDGIDLERASESDAPDPLQEVESVEDSARVVAALKQLDPAQRQAIECSFYEGLSHAQVAHRLGKPLGTIKSSIRTGLLKLREMLGESP